MIGGRPVYDSGKWLTLEAQGVLASARGMRRKLAAEGKKI
jgi:hypothetical protein